ncbi:MAG: exosortase C-terminal domain/associated protein EpsI, partial [Pseudomonadota bacterium]
MQLSKESFSSNNQMKTLLYRAVFVFLSMVIIAIFSQEFKPTERLADSKPAINLEKHIPKEFSDWTIDKSVMPILPNPELQDKLDVLYSSILARTYINSDGQRVMFSIAYGSDQGSEATAVHRPEFCYAAQGFKIKPVGQSIINLTASNSEPVNNNSKQNLIENNGNFNTAQPSNAQINTVSKTHQIKVQRLIGTQGRRFEPISYWVTLDEEVTLPGINRKLHQIKFGLKGQIPDGMLIR